MKHKPCNHLFDIVDYDTFRCRKCGMIVNEKFVSGYYKGKRISERIKKFLRKVDSDG